MKHLSLIILSLTLSGCSFVVDIMLFNNTDSSIEVCNINNSEHPCVPIASHEMGSVAMINSVKTDSWIYRINGKVYGFSFGTYPEHASEVYCKGFIQKRCAIPLQLEPSGLLYWAGKNSKLPVSNFVNQPKGFPVGPGA
ncbi:hypothetical protein R50072_28200 [Simiduia litorea]